MDINLEKPDIQAEIARPDIQAESAGPDIPAGFGGSAEKENGKKFIPPRYIWLLLCAIPLGAALLYLAAALRYSAVFLPGTVFGSTALSGMSPAQAQAAIDQAIDGYLLTLQEEGGAAEQIKGSDIGLHAEYGSSLQDILSQQKIFSWGVRLWKGEEEALSVPIVYDEERLLAAIDALSCMDKHNWTPSVNASIAFEKGNGYRIVPEVQGTRILSDVLTEAVKNALCHLDDTLSLSDVGAYQPPAILSDDDALREELALLAPYGEMSVTYRFGDHTEILDADTICSWVSVNGRGRLVIDREAAEAFIQELASKYNTAYSSKSLKTSYGEEVTIRGGNYGWLIDREQETEALLEIIRSGKSEEREPLYLQTAASHDVPDYGDTYVEINLTAQHLFFYQDGELIVESDFVSGNQARGFETPEGAYPLTYKERDAVLRGQGYNSPVSYWMPFNGNIGMHDSSWRSSYGGSIYKTNGSHGCINLPTAAARTIFEHIESGCPVLCYRLSGTETGSSQNETPDPADTEITLAEPEINAPGDGADLAMPDNGAVPEEPDTQAPTDSAETPILPDAGMEPVIPDSGAALP